MSRQVTVDYQAIAISCEASCNTAEESLVKIDKVISYVEKTASKLLDSDVKNYEKYLNESKSEIIAKINSFKATLKQYKALRETSVYDENPEYREYVNKTQVLQAQTAELTKLVNELTGEKLEMIHQIINEKLLDIGNNLFKEKGLDLNQNLLDRVNKIEDLNMRDLTYRELVKDKDHSLSFDELYKRAEAEYNRIVNNVKDDVVENYKQELTKKGIDSSVLDKAKDINEATQIKNAAITNESIRKETLKVIVKAIKSRGFIVDTKRNLKLDKERNIVKLLALKANGQKAEFEISLDGKFMYHFEEYEGHACKKDIEPFLEDLHNIYDVNILHEEVNWENPDKIQTQKYQYVNKNKGTN